MKKTTLIWIPIFALMLSSGCTTYKHQGKAMTKAWQSGDGVSAAISATHYAEKKKGSRDELIWLMEQGAIQASMGDIEPSQTALHAADELITRYEDEAKVKVASETVALLTNQASLPYRGRAYDKIMVNTYKALNYLVLSDSENARVELNRSLQRQRDAVTENNKKIEKALEVEEDQSKKKESDENYDVRRAKQDPSFSRASQAEISALESRLLPYKDYVNPFSVFLDGLFFSQMGLDNSDVERARKSFERVAAMSPGRYISADHAMAEAMAAGAQAEKITYLIFATGTAPSRSSVRIDIPLFLLTDEASYFGASFPRLSYHDDFIATLTVLAPDGKTYTSERLCSMDAVISQDFKNEWPAILTKTLLTAGVKATIGWAAEETARQSGNQWAQLAVKIASTTTQAATNIADLRTWTTLPKEFSYIRMPTPDSGQFQIQVGGHSQLVTVVAGKSNVLLIRSINNHSQPFLSQFTLN